MLEQIFIDNIIFALIGWCMIYVGDYYLTIYGARLYLAHGKEHLSIQGSYELTPTFQKDVDNLRLFSPRFFAIVVLSSILIGLIWFLSVRVLKMPEFYVFLLGGLILREAVVHIRHWRNITMFKLAAQPNAVQGMVGYSKWTTYKMSAAELFVFAVLYLLIGLTVSSWFVLGGAFACVVLSIQHQIRARRVNK
ncbi:MAG: hypothetical protein HZB51_04810 [Chloroflexi bacterium]|nr:hypothetical protein [Chloroflexota bacterium]